MGLPLPLSAEGFVGGLFRLLMCGILERERPAVLRLPRVLVPEFLRAVCHPQALEWRHRAAHPSGAARVAPLVFTPCPSVRPAPCPSSLGHWALVCRSLRL